MTLSGALGPAKTLDEWKRLFERMNKIGERVRRAGLTLRCHTGVGRRVDAGEALAAHPGRFFAVHLRDLKLPPPEGYIAFLPLGQGNVDWRRVLAGAKKGGVKLYIVEMSSKSMEILRLEIPWRPLRSAHSTFMI